MRTYEEISQRQWRDIKLWPKVGSKPVFLELMDIIPGQKVIKHFGVFFLLT